jgi:hypothetical protein
MWFTPLQIISFKSSINLPICTYTCNWPFKFRFSTLYLLVLCILSFLLSMSQLQNCNQDIMMEVQNPKTLYYEYIQGDSWEKVNILGDDSIGHCEKKKFVWTFILILIGYWDRDVWIPKQTKTVWMVIKKEKLITVNFIWILMYYLNDRLLHRNDTLVTVHNKRSEIPPSTSVHFATRVRRRCCSSELICTILYADSNNQNASEQYISCIHISVVNFIQSPKQI